MTSEAAADDAFGDAHRRLQDLRAILERVIVGQEELVGHLITAVFASGHVLVEGLPGLGRRWLTPACVTWLSCIASSSADCVRGVARLISSTRTSCANTGPCLNAKVDAPPAAVT